VFVHIWRMRARKKRVKDYEKFAQQLTMPSLKKLEGCLGAHFIRIFEARKPEYLWLVYWRDHKALEVARTNPIWRDQIKKFEAAQFYKSIPVELVCEALDSFGAPTEKTEKPGESKRPEKSRRTNRKAETGKGKGEDPADEPAAARSHATMLGPTAEGE